MGDGRNLILLRTAIFFILKDFRRHSLCSCQECLQSLIIPRHLEDDLKLIIFSPYFNGMREPITICLHRSGASDFHIVIELSVSTVKINTWSRIDLDGLDLDYWICINIII